MNIWILCRFLFGMKRCRRIFQRKGALSDFHTFAPDMMQLFAKGIKENQSLVLSQAETFSDNLADTFQNPFKINVDSEFNDFVLPELPALPALTSEINFKPDTVPEIDIPDLSVTADTNILDKIKEVLSDPLVISVQFADGFENIMDMFKNISVAPPEMAAVPHYTDEIRQIDEIKNTYSTTTNNFYSDTENNTYDTRKSYASDSVGNYTTVQNMTISVPNWNINSPADMDNLADALIDRIADRLNAKAIQDNRGMGGIGWQM